MYSNVNSVILSTSSKGALQFMRGPIAPKSPCSAGRTSSSTVTLRRWDRKCTDMAAERYLSRRILEKHTNKQRVCKRKQMDVIHVCPAYSLCNLRRAKRMRYDQKIPEPSNDFNVGNIVSEPSGSPRISNKRGCLLYAVTIAVICSTPNMPV